MSDNERRELIRSTIEEVIVAMPELELGFQSVAGKLQSGMTQEGCSLLQELLEVETRIGGFMHEVARELGEPYFALRVSDQSPIALRERWLGMLDRLRDGLKARDWTRTCDIVNHEATGESRHTRELLTRALALV
jgi:hypothetical protein